MILILWRIFNNGRHIPCFPPLTACHRLTTCHAPYGLTRSTQRVYFCRQSELTALTLAALALFFYYLVTCYLASHLGLWLIVFWVTSLNYGSVTAYQKPHSCICVWGWQEIKPIIWYCKPATSADAVMLFASCMWASQKVSRTLYCIVVGDFLPRNIAAAFLECRKHYRGWITLF